MPFILLGILAVGAIFFMGSEISPISGYKDVEPDEQGGTWKTTYDWAFSNAASTVGVPFALIKAHAIRESALKPDAFRDEGAGRGSYGLMQVMWWKGSGRFDQFGHSDDDLEQGSRLYDADINAEIAAYIIKENLDRFGNLRDAINAYNTGKAEKVYKAPHNYVDDVLKYYSTLVKGAVT